MVSPLYHPKLGGVGRQAVVLSEYLYRAGINVSVICRDIKDIPEWTPEPGLIIKKIWTLGSTKHDLEAKSVKNVLISLSFCINLLMTLIKHRRNYDIVHFHGASLPLILNVLPLKCMKKKIIAKVAGAKMNREAGSFRGKHFGVGDFFICILKKVDLFIAVSSEIRDDLINDGFDPERIFKTSNFIMPDKFYPETDMKRRQEIKNRLGIDTRKKCITFSGRLVPLKRLDILLKAVQAVSRKRKDFMVVILGQGELEAGLKKMASELGIDSHVLFKGHVPNILDYLHATDLFVFPSEKEGMPNALLEAMACGLPVIATRIGGAIDIIEDKKNGLLVTAGDVEELKDAMLKLLEDEQLSKSISEEAYRTIREKYYIDKVAGKYISLYKRVLNEV